MANEKKLEQERERAFKASHILENDVWQESWAHFEKNLRAHMESPDSSDEAVLEARRGLLILSKVRTHIENVFTTGRMAEIELERLHGRTAGTPEH